MSKVIACLGPEGLVVCLECKDMLGLVDLGTAKIYADNIGPLYSQWCHVCGKIVYRGITEVELFSPAKREAWQLFNESGELLVPDFFPAQCVEECTIGGRDASDVVTEWVNTLHFRVPRTKTIRYLSEFGAWDDLETASDDTLAERVLWITCHTIAEQGEWLGLGN